MQSETTIKFFLRFFFDADVLLKKKWNTSILQNLFKLKSVLFLGRLRKKIQLKLFCLDFKNYRLSSTTLNPLMPGGNKKVTHT